MDSDPIVRVRAKLGAGEPLSRQDVDVLFDEIDRLRHRVHVLRLHAAGRVS